MIVFAIFQSAKVQNIFGFCKLFCAYFNFLAFFLFICCKITFIMWRFVISIIIANMWISNINFICFNFIC